MWLKCVKICVYSLYLFIYLVISNLLALLALISNSICSSIFEVYRYGYKMCVKMNVYILQSEINGEQICVQLIW